MTPDQHSIRRRAALGGQSRRLPFQQGPHFQQVIQGARLIPKQVHQRADIAARQQRRDARALAMTRLDDALATQQPEPFAQRGPRDAQPLT